MCGSLPPQPLPPKLVSVALAGLDPLQDLAHHAGVYRQAIERALYHFHGSGRLGVLFLDRGNAEFVIVELPDRDLGRGYPLIKPIDALSVRILVRAKPFPSSPPGSYAAGKA